MAILVGVDGLYAGRERQSNGLCWYGEYAVRFAVDNDEFGRRKGDHRC